MRLLLVSNMYPSCDNPGYGVFVKNCEDSLRSRGALVDRVVIQGRGRGFFNKLQKYLRFGCKLFFLMLVRRYDVVYVHYIAHSLLPLVPLMGLKKVVLVCNAHGEDLLPRTRVEQLIFGIVKNTVAKSKVIIVPSEYFAQIAKKKFPRNEIFVSPSGGVDLSVFKSSPLKTQESPRNYLHIGFVSRIDNGKGWDVLLRAARELRRSNPTMKFRVSIVGEGSRVAELLSLICQFELTEFVLYLGALPQSKLPDFYSRLDVLVFPTVLTESLGLVGLEALACGVPVICSDIGGMRSYMRDGVNGYLFEPGNAEELEEKIIKFVSLSPDEVAALQSAALATSRCYGREVVASELYSKLVKVVGS